MTVPNRSWTWGVVLVVLSGCGGTPEAHNGTGAREAVRDYYEGLIRQDWQQAYTALHHESKKRWTLDAFTRLAQAYRRNLGFEPEELHVQSCEEKGTEAVAHVVLTGRNASQQRRYKDAVALRTSADGWKILLPVTFGRNAR
ncbi:MAG TPA: hypothetical protein VH592_15015 [Gemmataceae bacterium]|jgi:hypothetical protein